MKPISKCIALLPPIAACVVLSGTAAQAQNIPPQAYRYVVGAGPGSAVDIVGRIVAEGLTQAMKAQFIVDNRPGTAGVNTAAEFVAKAPPDGHTMLQAAVSHAINVTLYRKLSYDIVRDFAPLTLIATSPDVLVVHPSLPVRTAGELIKLAKSRPGVINYASAGTGTGTFFAAEMFKAAAGVNIVHVPYRGGNEALVSVLSGETSVYFGPVPSVMPNVQQGKLRMLAVTTARRLPLAPRAPTIAEAGVPGYEFGNWYGLLLPVKTPRETVSMLHSAAVGVLKKTNANQRLNELGYIVVASEPEEMTAHLKADIAKLGKIIKQAGVSAE